MLGVSREYGDLLIGASDDDGVSWTAPTVLFRGANCSNMSGLHRAPMPVLISHGRIMTDVQYGAWHTKVFGDAVLSARSTPICCAPKAGRLPISGCPKITVTSRLTA